MLKIWKLLLLVVRKFRRKSAIATPSSALTVADVYAAGLTPPPEEQATEAIRQPNRAARRSLNREHRRYERQRRKFDKFVEPKGESPMEELK